MKTNAINAYRTSGVLTADPITLTTLLYDGALNAMRRARVEFETGSRVGFVDSVNRAYMIVGELLATLDMRQGDIPRTLSGVYTYCLRNLVECTLGDMAKLAEAEHHIGTVADAWKQAMAGLNAGDSRAQPGTEAVA